MGFDGLGWEYPQKLESLKTPPAGWIRAIRNVLGMTASQLAKRMGVSQPRIHMMEKAEASRTIRLDTLEKAAKAMNCRLVYFLIPDTPSQKFGEILSARVREKAKKRMDQAGHTMALENQAMTQEEYQRQFNLLMMQLSSQAPKKIWHENDLT